MTLTMWTRNAWSQPTFARLFAASPKKAFQYRFEVLWTPIPPEYADEVLTETEAKEVAREIDINTIETQSSWELTRDELKQKLTTAWIEFFANAKTEKLKELALENNLI